MPRDVLASLDVANVHKEILRCRCQKFAVMGERQGPKIKKDQVSNWTLLWSRFQSLETKNACP